MMQNVSAPLSCFLSRRSGFAAFPASALVLFFVLLAAFPYQARAIPPTKLVIERTFLTVRNGVLRFGFSATVDDEEGLRELLKDGAVLELRAALAIERERSWWANAEVYASDYASVLRHDPLSRDFIVVFPNGDGERELRDRNLTRLLYESWKNLSLPLVPPDSLSRQDGETYQLNFSISLRHIEVPPWLGKSLVFWSAEVVPPESGTLPVPPPED